MESMITGEQVECIIEEVFIAILTFLLGINDKELILDHLEFILQLF